MSTTLRSNGLGVCAFLLAGSLAGINAVAASSPWPLQDVNASCPSGQTNFYGTCVSLLKLFGQTRPGETSPNAVTGNKTYINPGVVVDRSVKPNRVYVVDINNNRILGWSSLGVASGNPNRPCSNDTDVAPGDTCLINPARAADIVIGQPDFQSGACNQDGNLGVFRSPRADTLCLQNYPLVGNVNEAFYSVNFDVDGSGNLYIADTYNNRVLRYNNPFGKGRAAGIAADFVWGQPDFQSNALNEGRGANRPDATSVAFTIQYRFPNVSVDPSGNVWVGDTGNSRVLRFPPNSKTADLVLGQPDFTTVATRACAMNNQPCSAGAAKVNPATGELYVAGGTGANTSAQYLVFSPPFSNSMTATRILTPTLTQPMTDGSPYVFEPVSFEFNRYKQGAYAAGDIWVNEFIDFGRTLLIDASGNIIKVIGSTAINQKGGILPGSCGDLNNYYDWQPLGSIGFDDASNIYIASTRSGVISIYKLPTNNYTLSNGTVCPAKPSGGLLLNDGPANVPDPTGAHLGPLGSGVIAYRGQLIAQDNDRTLAWNNFPGKANGPPADALIGYGGWNIQTAAFAVDDQGRLWDTIGGLRAYALPLANNSASIAANLYWANTGAPVAYGDPTGLNPVDYVAFDPARKKLWLSDPATSRIFRISNYNDIATPGAKLYVDMVLGQTNSAGTSCNQGLAAPTAQTLCNPTDVRADQAGNLYVNDDSKKDLSCGNNRVVVYLAQDLNSAAGMFPNLAAKRIFNAGGSFTTPGQCGLPRVSALALDNAGHLAMSKSDPGVFFGALPLQFYANPLAKQSPDAQINIPGGYLSSLYFDEQDNLLIQDSDWPKIWAINLDSDPQWLLPAGLFVTISSPAPGAAVSGAITVKGAAFDKVAVAGVAVSTDGVQFSPASGAGAWTYNLDTSSLPNGSLLIMARATSTSGSTATATVSVFIGQPPVTTNPPTVYITAPANGAVVAGALSVTGTAFGNVAVAGVAVSTDGVNFSPASGAGAWTYNLDTSSMTNGSLLIMARATDISGSTATASVTVTVSNPASISPPPGYPNPPPGTTPPQIPNDFSSLKVYPNPWRSDQTPASPIRFDPLPANSTLRLFTVSGRLVKTLSASSGVIRWDRTNESGETVGSGLYVYLLTDDQGGKRQGKLAIIR